MKPFTKIILIYSIGCALICSLAVLFVTRTELAFNRTASLPYSVFLVIKGWSYDKGDLVCIKGHPTKYFNGISFTKKVVGVSGDSIQHPPQKSHTLSGLPLTPLQADSVPMNHVYVLADHPDSFDSRYEEFGLVSAEHIVGRAFPLW